MRYDYWVVRFVPDAVRGEFVNIAVIAGVGHDWAMRRALDLRRASRLGGSTSLAAPTLRRIQAAIETQLQDVAAVIPDRGRALFTRGDVEDLRTRMNNTVQLSEARPVLANSAADAAELAFELMVIDRGHESKPRSRTRVVRELTDAFDLHPELVDRVARSQFALVGKQKQKFDFAVSSQSESEVLQLSQVWEFDLKQMDNLQRNIRSWDFLVQLIREAGGVLGSSNEDGSRKSALIPSGVSINAVYTTPSTSQGEDELAIALDGWRQLEIAAVPADRYEQVIEQAEALV